MNYSNAINNKQVFMNDAFLKLFREPPGRAAARKRSLLVRPESPPELGALPSWKSRPGHAARVQGKLVLVVARGHGRRCVHMRRTWDRGSFRGPSNMIRVLHKSSRQLLEVLECIDSKHVFINQTFLKHFGGGGPGRAAAMQRGLLGRPGSRLSLPPLPRGTIP